MARYKDAINWIIDNDDTSEISDWDDTGPVMTVQLVADLFNKTDGKVIADIRREIAKTRERNMK